MYESDVRNIHWHSAQVGRIQRQTLNGHRDVVLWFTGLSGAGKFTLTHVVEASQKEPGFRTYVLDGDNLRHGVCAVLVFSAAGRLENISRISGVARRFVDSGGIGVTAIISPFRDNRAGVQPIMPTVGFIEIYFLWELRVCEQRVVKGIYAKARQSDIQNFNGIPSPFEPPGSLKLVFDTELLPLEDCVEKVMLRLEAPASSAWQ